jgi:hypothetical protein
MIMEAKNKSVQMLLATRSQQDEEPPKPDMHEIAESHSNKEKNSMYVESINTNKQL